MHFLKLIPMFLKFFHMRWLKILYRCLYWNSSGIRNWYKYRFNCFLKVTNLFSAACLPTTSVVCRCSIHILLDFWMTERCLQGKNITYQTPWLPHLHTSSAYTNHNGRKEYTLPIQEGSTEKSKWKLNPGNLVKTKVGFPITWVSPCQATRLKNKHLFFRKDIHWLAWLPNRNPSYICNTV